MCIYMYIYMYMNLNVYTNISHGIASFPHHPRLLWFREQGLWSQPVWSCLGAFLTRLAWAHPKNTAKQALKLLLLFDFLLGQHYWVSDFSETSETGCDDCAEASWHARKAPAAHHLSFRGYQFPNQSVANQPLLICWALPVPGRSTCIYRSCWDLHLRQTQRSSRRLRRHFPMGTAGPHTAGHLSEGLVPPHGDCILLLTFLFLLCLLVFLIFLVFLVFLLLLFFHLHRGGCIAFLFWILCLSNGCNVKVT